MFFLTSIAQFFPRGKLWLTLPAVPLGFFFSLGIILANKVSPILLFPLYNDIISYAIYFLLFVTFINKNVPIRILLFFILGFLIYSFHYQRENDFYSRLEKKEFFDQPIKVTGRIISPPIKRNNSYIFFFSVNQLTTATHRFSLNNKVFKGISALPLLANVNISGKARLFKPHQGNNPFAFNQYAYFRANNLWGRIVVDSLLTVVENNSFTSKLAQLTRTRLVNVISCIDDVHIQGILKAVFLGDKTGLTKRTTRYFREAGVYHLLAISGIHVAILISSVIILLKFIPLPRLVKIAITITVIWLYLLFIGFIPSLFRAVVMATLVLLSTLVQRNIQIVNSLFVAGIIWLFMSPSSLWTQGFQLSFAATFGIIILFPILYNQGIPKVKGHIPTLVIKSIFIPFYVSLSAFIATVPILIYHFGTISLFGLVANIGAVLLMSIAMNTFFIAILCQFVWFPLGLFFTSLTKFFLLLLIRLTALSHYVPWALINLSVPYLEYFVFYISFFLGLAMVNKNYLRHYLTWMLSLFMFLVPLVFIIHRLNAKTEIIIFHTQPETLLGISFPNNKLWILGAMAKPQFIHPYTTTIKPWLHHSFGKKIDAFILPKIPDNIVHHLNPLLEDYHPQRVIYFNTLPDGVFRNDFISFLQSASIIPTQIDKKGKIIPSANCTCTVLKPEVRGKWYEKKISAGLKLAFPEMDIIITDPSEIYNNSPRPPSSYQTFIINDSIFIYYKVKKPGKIYFYNNKCRKSKKLKSNYLTTKCGAIKITLD